MSLKIWPKNKLQKPKQSFSNTIKSKERLFLYQWILVFLMSKKTWIYLWIEKIKKRNIGYSILKKQIIKNAHAINQYMYMCMANSSQNEQNKTNVRENILKLFWYDNELHSEKSMAFIRFVCFSNCCDNFSMNKTQHSIEFLISLQRWWFECIYMCVCVCVVEILNYYFFFLHLFHTDMNVWNANYLNRSVKCIHVVM